MLSLEAGVRPKGERIGKEKGSPRRASLTQEACQIVTLSR